jgi:hypothetical protein
MSQFEVDGQSIHFETKDSFRKSHDGAVQSIAKDVFDNHSPAVDRLM